LRRAYLLGGPQLNPIVCNRIQSCPKACRAEQMFPPVLAPSRCRPRQVPSHWEAAYRVVWPASRECQDLGGHLDRWRGSNTESRRAGSSRMWCCAWPSEGKQDGSREKRRFNQHANRDRAEGDRVKYLVSRKRVAMRWGVGQGWLAVGRKLSRSPTASSCCVFFFASQHRFPLAARGIRQQEAMVSARRTNASRRSGAKTPGGRGLVCPPGPAVPCNHTRRVWLNSRYWRIGCM
jgi:hypothetical protein